MRIIKTFLVLLLITLSSCKEDIVYQQFDKNFEENRWQKSDVKNYDFEITQDATNYSMDIGFSHIYGYQFASIPLTIVIENPDKTTTTKNIELEILDENGKEKAECAGDICDLYVNVFENQPLEVGQYKVKISHQFEGEYLPNVLQFGVLVMSNAD